MKKILLLIILFCTLNLIAADFDVETVKEMQTERELAQWIESMLFPMVGETIVIANLTLQYPSSKLEVYGSTLDKKKSLPGLPIAKSKSVMPTTIDDQETYPTIIAKKEITIYLKRRASNEMIQFLEQNITLWMSILPERGDKLFIKNVKALNSGIEQEEEISIWQKNRVFLMVFAIFIIMLVVLYIANKGFKRVSDSLHEIHVPGLEKLSKQGISQINSSKDNIFAHQNKPLEIKVVEDIKVDEEDFRFLEDLSLPHLEKIFSDESAEDIAFVLLRLSSDFVSEFINNFSNSVPILSRMLKTKNMKSNEVKKLRERVYTKYKNISNSEMDQLNSKQKIFNLLNKLNNQESEKALVGLIKHDKDAENELRAGVFLYNQITGLSDGKLEQIVQNTDHQFFVKYLKSADSATKGKFISALTPRARNIIEEDIKYLDKLSDQEQEEIRYEMLINIRKILNFIKE